MAKHDSEDIPTIAINLDWPTDGPVSGFSTTEKQFIAYCLQDTLHTTIRIVLFNRHCERIGNELEKEDEGMGSG